MSLEGLIRGFIKKEGFSNIRTIFEDLYEDVKKSNTKYLFYSFFCFILGSIYVILFLYSRDFNFEYNIKSIPLVDSIIIIIVFYSCFIYNSLRYNKAHRLLILLETYDDDIFKILDQEQDKEEKIKKLVFIVKVLARSISESVTITPLTFIIMLFDKDNISIKDILKI